MIVAGTESSSSIHDATKNGAAAVAQIIAELEVDVGHDQLDGDWEHGATNIGVAGLRIVEEYNGFASATTSSTGTLRGACRRCSASHTGD